MKKLVLTMLATAAFALASCTPDQLNADSIESNLKREGYTTTHVNDEDSMKVMVQGLTWNVKVTDVVSGTKTATNYIIAFVCESAEDAEKFGEENIYVFYNSTKALGDEQANGQFNNVVYCGSKTAVKAAGLTLE